MDTRTTIICLIVGIVMLVSGCLLMAGPGPVPVQEPQKTIIVEKGHAPIWEFAAIGVPAILLIAGYYLNRRHRIAKQRDKNA